MRQALLISLTSISSFSRLSAEKSWCHERRPDQKAPTETDVQKAATADVGPVLPLSLEGCAESGCAVPLVSRHYLFRLNSGRVAWCLGLQSPVAPTSGPCWHIPRS